MKISPLNLRNTIFKNSKQNVNAQRQVYFNRMKNDSFSFRGVDQDKKTIQCELTKNFFDDVVFNPRSSKKVVEGFILQAGGVEEFQKWYFDKNGYKQAYENYVQDVCKNPNSPDDLLRISPNWFPWIFEEKFGTGYTFGELPEEFGSKEDYRTLVDSILKGEKTEGVKKFKGGASGKKAFLLTMGDKKYVLKVQNDYLFHLDEIRESLKKYPWFKKDFMENYQYNEDMRSDSSYLNAMIDRYLNLHNCQNATKLHFYDSKNSSALYDFVQGEKFNGEPNILNINSLLQDMDSLGIIYNDVNPGNFIVYNGVIKVIDSGESGFADLLRPTVKCLQFDLPNWSGNGIGLFRTGISPYLLK